MKNLMKPIVVLGMTLLLLGVMTSCKEKSEEEEIEELVEKMGEAKTEQEAAKIAEKIAKLQERKEKKEIKEIEAELGKPFTFWQFGGLAMNEKITQFSMTFEVISVHKQHPFVPEVARTPKGKKHVKLIAKIRNLGPREGTPSANMELKVDKGYIYNVGPFGDMYPGPRYEPAIFGKTMYSLEPGQTGWKLFHSEIPEDTTPVEIFGTLGGATFPRIPGKLKFRLKILPHYLKSKENIEKSYRTKTREIPKKEIAQSKKISKDNILGEYIFKSGSYRQPGVVIFREDGIVIDTFSGRWNIDGNVITFYEEDKIREKGQISGDSIVERQYYVPEEHEWSLPSDETLAFVKKKGSTKIKILQGQEETSIIGLQKISLWSDYGTRDLKCDLKVRDDGTFSRERFFGKWKVKNGVLKIQDAEVEVKGNTIVLDEGLGLILERVTEAKAEQKIGSNTVYAQWEQDEKRLRADLPELQFKKLSPEEEIEAQRLFEAAMTERKMGRLPGIRLGYKNMVYHCREIIRRWPDSEYAFKAKRMLADIPERYHKMYNITKEEMDFSNFYQTPATNKQELVDALEDLRHAMIKKIQLEVDVTAQCFTSVKEYRRAKLLADVLRPVLRVLQGTLSVLSKISDATTLSGQVKTSLDNAQYVSEATSLFFMINGLRESGEKLHYAIDDTAGYVRTVKDMLQAADQTTVVRMDPRAYKQVIKQYLDSEQGTPLVIARTSELAPDKKPAKGALVLYKTIREEFRTLIDQIQRSELPQDFPLQDAVAEIEQLKHQIVEAGVHNIDVHYSIYHQGRKVHQSRKLGAVAEHNKAFAQVAGALAKRLDIEIYAECAQLAATGADAAYIVTYKVPGAGEAVKMTQQVSLLPQIVIEGKKMFTVDPEEQFYQMPQEMLFSLAIEFSSLLRIADDTVLSLTELLKETRSQVPPGEVRPVPTSTKQKEPAKQIEKQVEEAVKSLFKKLLRKKR